MKLWITCNYELQVFIFSLKKTFFMKNFDSGRVGKELMLWMTMLRTLWWERLIISRAARTVWRGRWSKLTINWELIGNKQTLKKQKNLINLRKLYYYFSLTKFYEILSKFLKFVQSFSDLIKVFWILIKVSEIRSKFLRFNQIFLDFDQSFGDSIKVFDFLSKFLRFVQSF